MLVPCLAACAYLSQARPLTIDGSRCLLQIGGSAIAAFSVDAPGGAASDGSILANLSQGGLLQSVQSSPQWTSRSVQ